MNWWQRLRHHDQLEPELDAELRFHVDAQVQEHVRNGLTDAEARRRTRVEFGGLDQVKEDCRDARGARWLEELAQDLRFSLRLLTRRRAFTLAATMALALGIGVNGLFLTLVEMICLREVPIDRPDRVLYLAARDGSGRNQAMSYREFEHVRDGALSFSGVAAFATAPLAIADEGRAPDRFSGTYISAGAFRLLGESSVVGREFRPEDDRPGAPPVVILAHGAWHARYGGDPSIVGQIIRVNGAPATVIGVMPDGFRFPPNTDVWQPLSSMPEIASERRDERAVSALGRLVDGTTLAEARGELDAIAVGLARDRPGIEDTVRLTAVPISERYNGNATDLVWIAFMTAGGLVLLVTCANVANLLLMRSTERFREIAIRASIGATRRRVVRQLLTESTVLAVLGGALGLGLALAGLHLVSSMTPRTAWPYWKDFTIDGRVFLLLTAICLGTSFVFGLVPALQLSRANASGAATGSRRGARPNVRFWTAAFTVTQLALALILLANMALGMWFLLADERRDLPVDMAGVLTMSVALPYQTYPTPGERARFYEQLEERIANIDSTSSVAVASALPLGGSFTRRLSIEGRVDASGASSQMVRALAIGPRYFQTLGVPIVRGRAFDDRDGTPGYAHAIVNQRFAEVHFPDADPIGRRVLLASDETGSEPVWLTIVGLSTTVRQQPALVSDPVVYLPYRADAPALAALMIRHPSGLAVASRIREEVRVLDPDLPLYRVMTLEQAAAESRWNGRVSNLLLAMLTGIAVGLCAVGLYAVTTYAVTQRSHEIGIRMALGAQPAQVRWLVLRRVMLQLGAGLLLGLAGTLAWERLFVTSTATPTVTSTGYDMLGALEGAIAAAAFLTIVTAAACLVPARRAPHLNPALALRRE